MLSELDQSGGKKSRSKQFFSWELQPSLIMFVHCTLYSLMSI